MSDAASDRVRIYSRRADDDERGRVIAVNMQPDQLRRVASAIRMWHDDGSLPIDMVLSPQAAATIAALIESIADERERTA